MNKKIYYNNKFIGFDESIIQSSQNQTFKFYKKEDQQSLKKIIEDFLNETNSNSIIILNYDFETVFNYFQKDFSYIEAAGGFIEKNTQFLFIHRLGKWDLPKGKLDKGETIENAAVRECEEECAVTNLKIIKRLASTFHIYPYKKAFALKQTFWFYMKTDHAKKLIPQTEENIDEVLWFSEKDAKNKVYNDTYLTIKDVILEALGPANIEK
ncbi:MAG: NUDIX domain-containing protein [Bacteroidetes bacterium]|nr:NUDIX domain-containing protein [Bacteroidota bacterium]